MMESIKSEIEIKAKYYCLNKTKRHYPFCDESNILNGVGEPNTYYNTLRDAYFEGVLAIQELQTLTN